MSVWLQGAKKEKSIKKELAKTLELMDVTITIIIL